MRKIREIAKQARRWGERIAENYEELDSSTEELEYLCAICSAHLFCLLKKEGYDPVIVENDEHCFVLCDGKLVDVTASQFNKNPKVICREYIEDEEISYWQIENQYDSVERFMLFQNHSDWPDNQKASKFKKYLGKPTRVLKVM